MAVQLATSSNIAASAATSTTARLTAPSGKTTGDFQAGRISDDTNPLPAIDLASGKYTELAWAVKIVSPAVAAEQFEFRVVDSTDAPINTYTVTPRLTVEGGGSGPGAAFYAKLRMHFLMQGIS
jgi:hypothetical protein